MKKFTDIKIRGQIRFIIIIVALILVSSASAILYLIGEILVDKTKGNYEANTNVVEANISTILNSIKINNNNYSYVLEMSEALTSGTFRKKRLEDYFVNGYAKFNSFFDETMEGLILLPIHGEEIIVGNKEIMNRVFQKIKELYDFESNVYQKTFFAESIFDESTNAYYFACVSPIYRENTSETVGYFISIINNDFINNIFEINQEKELDAVILLAENNKIINSNKEISHEAVEKVMKYINDYSKEEYISIENSDHLYFEKVIENTDWKIITLIPKEKIQRSAVSLRPIFAAIGIVSIIILAFVCRKTISAITRPVEQIVEKLDEYESSEEFEDIETPLKNEISEISTHINEMMHKVKNSNEELLDTQKTLFQLEIAMVQAELSYYQSQINPHFLYNTLECIRSLATIYDAPEIEKLSLAMSKIFRYAVKEETIVTLEDELKCVEEYINVMTLRFPGKYEYILDIDESIKEIPIIKMTLQPIIENCFKYGTTNKKKNAKIYVRNKIEQKYVDIEVIDTGKGISEEKLKEINEYLLKDEEKDITNNNGGRLGLKNINKRIKLCFGKDYGVKIESKEGFYTKVILKLPRKN